MITKTREYIIYEIQLDCKAVLGRLSPQIVYSEIDRLHLNLYFDTSHGFEWMEWYIDLKNQQAY